MEQAYFNLVSNRDNITTAELAVEQAREALTLAQLRFDAGVGTQLDVLSATRELTEAEGNFVRPSWATTAPWRRWSGPSVAYSWSL